MDGTCVETDDPESDCQAGYNVDDPATNCDSTTATCCLANDACENAGGECSDSSDSCDTGSGPDFGELGCPSGTPICCTHGTV
jgi:hypothetical protein